jgi:multidrug efflux pump subunit AcrB
MVIAVDLSGSPWALLDAGILRLRPVLIRVGATIFALVMLALHGGPRSTQSRCLIS